MILVKIVLRAVFSDTPTGGRGQTFDLGRVEGRVGCRADVLLALEAAVRGPVVTLVGSSCAAFGPGDLPGLGLGGGGAVELVLLG